MGSIYISFKTNFIQFRSIPKLLKVFSASMLLKKEETGTILPHKALFTAMSTTLGIGTIVGPVVAIHWGGPGALLGFLLTAFLGSAATYSEVMLGVKFRKKTESGAILGGPMQYIRALLSPAAAKWYAVSGAILMCGWSAAQANQLVAILDSPFLGQYRIPSIISGGIISLLVFVTLIGGIKRISSLSSKLVPVMFILYLGATFWILISNTDKFGTILGEIFHSAFTPYAMATGGVVGGVVSAFRWGIFKGIHATEAGVGTQAIPHSMAETSDPHAQGILAMISTFTAGIIAFFSGCVALITETWQNPELPLGISMVAASFELYFSYFGIAIIAVITLLFAFGTILGNSYNGSQCFSYLTDNKRIYFYYFSTAIVIFLGAILETKIVWSLIDFGLVFLVVPHMATLMYHYMPSSKQKKISTV
jgi:AGCS family alanine or glycine:cation symporter